jgi:hypothetical protein
MASMVVYIQGVVNHMFRLNENEMISNSECIAYKVPIDGGETWTWRNDASRKLACPRIIADPCRQHHTIAWRHVQDSTSKTKLY